MRGWILSALLSCLVAGPAAAATEAGSMEIGGIEVTIGAPEKELLEKLRASYQVDEVRGGVYQVTVRTQPEAAAGEGGGAAEGAAGEAKSAEPQPVDRPPPLLGMVQFRDGKVVWASRDAGAFEGPEVRSFGQALFNALASLNPETAQSVKLTTTVNHNPTWSVGSITMEFPGRQLIVYVSYDDDLVDASIEEILVPEEGSELHAQIGN
jgi:hypothetical protein